MVNGNGNGKVWRIQKMNSKFFRHLDEWALIVCFLFNSPEISQDCLARLFSMFASCFRTRSRSPSATSRPPSSSLSDPGGTQRKASWMEITSAEFNPRALKSLFKMFWIELGFRNFCKKLIDFHIDAEGPTRPARLGTSNLKVLEAAPKRMKRIRTIPVPPELFFFRARC